MSDNVISLTVDPEIARAYNQGTEEDRLRIQFLLRLRLREWMAVPRRPLREVMNDIATEAQARGLTPEILEELLRDD